MAAITTASETASASLQCKTWVLKVSMHCEGCKREVKKALQKLEGVYRITVDSKQHKVTVTGNISSEALLNKLTRIGKHAEILQENSPIKSNPEKCEKQNVQKVSNGEPANNNGNGGRQRNSQVAVAATSQATTDTSHKTANPAKISNPGGKAVAKICKETKAVLKDNSNKGKGQKGNFQKKGNADAMPKAGSKQGKTEKEDSPENKKSQITIPDPTETDSRSSEEIVLSYNLAQLSSGRTHDLYYQYIPSEPSVYTDADQLRNEQEQLVQEHGNEVRDTSMKSFDIFNEENANGCSIM